MNLEIKKYHIDEVSYFHKSSEEWGEFGNMTGGFRFRITPDILIPSTENLYQAMRFTDYPEIQQAIIETKSGFACKLVAKKYRQNFTRPDFEDIKIDIMKWCLQLKLLNHLHTFGNSLLLTGTRDIVERSSKDNWWGAKVVDNTLVGVNVLGQLLMEVRDSYKKDLDDGTDNYKLVIPPDIPDFCLYWASVPTIDRRTKSFLIS